LGRPGRRCHQHAGTLYRIGSLTKQFTALAVLKLQELGKLKVTDRVCRHVTACPAAWKAVTIEHLLIHTSGISEYNGGNAEYTRTARSPEELVGLFRDRPTRFAPGLRFQYSNAGYVLLGYLIERLSGQSYGEFLRQQILDPLGLAATGIDHPASDLDAVGYTGGNTRAEFVDLSIPYAAGALYSSVDDLFRWNRFLLTRTPAIVPPATLPEMFTARVPIDASTLDSGSYGYGWLITGRTDDVTYSHDGGIPGFKSANLIKPRHELSVTVLSNDQSIRVGTLAEHLAAIALR
jgi:CubicO group peptidase (beta-lactamase class C family)